MNSPEQEPAPNKPLAPKGADAPTSTEKPMPEFPLDPLELTYPEDPDQILPEHKGLDRDGSPLPDPGMPDTHD